MKRSVLAFTSVLMAFSLAAPTYAHSGSQGNLFRAMGKMKVVAHQENKRSESREDRHDHDNHAQNHQDKHDDSPKDDQFFGFRNLVGMITGVDLQAKTLLVTTNGKSTRTVKAEGAVILSVGADSAKVITFAELKTGQRASFLLKKQRGMGVQSTHEALLITQFSMPVPPPATQPQQPTVQFSSAVSTGAESVTPVNIPVTLSKVSSHDVKVQYTVAGTATGAGVDYTLSNGELTIPAGQTTGNLSLGVTNDTIDESDETVVVTLSGATNGTLGSTSVHTYTVLDND
ncbi:MAG: Calx-beta domain-containing protein [Patescibacteria group bacterium]